MNVCVINNLVCQISNYFSIHLNGEGDKRGLIMETQEILENLYDDVIAKLQIRLLTLKDIADMEKETLANIAEELNVNIKESEEKLTEKDRYHTLKIALMPVAQACVVTMFRALLNECKEKGRINYQFERLSYLWKNYTFDWTTFPKSIGLNKGDAEFAVMCTEQVFEETDLFDSPIIVTVDGRDYKIKKDQNQYDVAILGEEGS